MSAVGRSVYARKNQRRTQHRTGHQSGGRAVKRDLPRSHLHRAARASRCPLSRLRTGDRHTARRRMSEHEAQASEREHPRVSLKGTRV